jgi:acetyltransferase-like isoleucine patch superfamily enzyme
VQSAARSVPSTVGLVRRVSRRFNLRGEWGELLHNRLLTHVPSNAFRMAFLRALGLSAGEHVYLFGGSEILAPALIGIAGNCHVGRFCLLDGRGGISIGRNVVIASHCLLITADHDIDAPGFDGRLAPITIGDRAWLGSRAIVLKGVTIGEGAVVAAGTVVHEDVEPWTVVSGVPARPVRTRSRHQTYEVDHGPEWY